MLKSYLTIALRNLRKGLAYSVINIAGLAIGITCCILMLMYVQDELTFDMFHRNADHIYRVLETRQAPDKGVRHFPLTMGPAGPALVEEFPEIVDEVRLLDRSAAGRFTVRHGANRFYEGDYIFAEPSFLTVFDFRLLEGDPVSALKEPRSVVLTSNAAQKYFGVENPMGQVLTVERYGDLKVTGLLQDPPDNSHLDFSMVLSFSTLESSERGQKYTHSWNSDGFITYVLTDRTLDTDAFNARLAGFIKSHRGEEQGEQRRLSLQPLRDIHFGPANLESDRNHSKGEISYVYIFSMMALFVLLIACINYMNLATARSMKRAQETGIRKVVGAHMHQLVGQFLSESILLSTFSLALAIVLVEFLLPQFNSMTGKHLILNPGSNIVHALTFPALVLLVGIVAGSYPAFYLSRLKPSAIFRRGTRRDARGSLLRRVLVIAQFALSIIMIVSTVVAHDQLTYIQTKSLGFNQDQLVIIDINSGGTRENFRVIKDEMSRIPSVKSVSVSSRVPGEWKDITEIDVVPEGATDADQRRMFFFAVDEDFLRTFEMSLVAGRNLSSAMGTDTSAILINETAARLLGWNDPLHKEIRVPERNFRARVVGVVKDFHFQSLHEPIGPAVLGHWKNPFYPIDYFTCRIATNDIPRTLADIQQVHERFDHVTPFEYNFLDERINDFYRRDIRVGKIFGIAADLTMFVACLGLLGLAAFAAETRTKEIGIRKTLGASVANVTSLLSMDFLKLVLIANIVAWPMAWFAMNRWLENFAYRIDISWWTFVLAGSISLVIALLTVSTQAVKAALTNPVEALRYE